MVEPHPSYLSQYRAQLQHIHWHLLGRSEDDADALQPSFLPPNGYWTSGEKDLFFHALKVHSRLRPDLISESIQTKNVLEVCAYIDLLDAATSSAAPLRDTLPFAIETSDASVEREEAEASILASLEPSWEKEAHKQEHKAEAVYAKTECLTGACGPSSASTCSHKRTSEEYKAWHAEKKIAWERDETLRHLTLPTLKVIGSLIREAEVSVNPSNIAETGAALIPDYKPPLQLHDPGKKRKRAPSLEDSVSTEAIPDHLIDPALRKPVHVTPATTPPQTQTSRDPNPDPPSDMDMDTIDVSTLSPVSRRRHQKRLYMRRKRAEAKGISVDSVASTVVRLKPGRAPTEKKENPNPPRSKTYKKRKSKKPEDVKEEEADEKPGGSTFARRTNRLNVETSDWEKGSFNQVSATERWMRVAIGIKDPHLHEIFQSGHPSGSRSTQGHASNEKSGEPEDNENEDDTEPRFRYYKASGKKAFYRIKEKLENLGLDAPTLAEEGLGLFRMAGIMDYMKLYHEDTTNAQPLAISSSTIALLEAHLVAFVTELIHRVITLVEERVRLREGIKVWRNSGKIPTTEDIEDALAAMGYDWLLDMFQDDESSGSDDEEQAQPSSRSASVSSEESEPESEGDDDDKNPTRNQLSPQKNSLASARQAMVHEQPTDLPIHQALYTPLIRLPSVYYTAGEALIPEDEDEDALLEELLEEKKLDKKDQEADATSERQMWEDVLMPIS